MHSLLSPLPTRVPEHLGHISTFDPASLVVTIMHMIIFVLVIDMKSLENIQQVMRNVEKTTDTFNQHSSKLTIVESI